MAAVEVFTVGGGEYIVNVFNAVAAWTGQGGYKSLIQVAMVMGLAMATLTIAFDSDWRAWINWFLGATLMYTCLMVPRLDVQVTDRINPSLAPSYIANVPLGLALVASFTSQVGDYLTTSAEVVFGLPNDLNYSANGMVYGARLYEATQGIQFNDAEFATNLDEHMRNCVFYDVLLGHKAMATLANASDLWAVLGPGSPARAQKFLTLNGDGTVTSAIVTCQQAYTNMSNQLSAADGPIDKVLAPLSRSMFPKLAQTAAKAKLLADLGGSYNYLTGVSATASEIMKQNLMVNAMTQAMHTMSSAAGGSSVDVYAQTRAEIQTRNTYSSISQAAMKWVPLLNIVLTVMFYALFPVLFPLFLMPKVGVSTLKGYITGFFYLAAWGPLFVILHMILMFKGASDIHAAVNGSGYTLLSSTGIDAVTGDVSLLAGYLIASVPFIAGGVARGAMAISGSATSFLQPSQNAAEVAANEASTGNIALGNTSLDNFSGNNRQSNNWGSAGSYSSGASVFSTRGSDGFQTNSYPDAEVGDASGAISRLAVSPQLNSALESSYSTSASEARSRSQSLSNSASSSFSAANTQASEFRHALSNGGTLERSLGADDRSTIGTANTEIENAATALQNRYGFERNKAVGLANETFFNGSVNTGLSALGGGGRAGGAGAGVGAGGAGPGGRGIVNPGGSVGLGVSTGMSKRVTDSAGASGTDSLSEAKDFLQQYGRSHNWSQQKDAFDRVTQNSSNSDISSRASSVNAAYTKANSVAHEARTAYDDAQRYETAADLRETSGASVSQNLSQQYVNYVLRQQALLGGTGGKPFAYNPTRGLATTPEAQKEEAYFIKGFVAEQNAKIKAGVEPSLIEPTAAGIVGPSANSQSKIASLGAGGIAAVQGHELPGNPNVPTAVEVYTVNRARVAATDAGAARVDQRVDSRDRAFKKVTPTLSPEPGKTLENVIGNDDRGTLETIRDGIVGFIAPDRTKK